MMDTQLLISGVIFGLSIGSIFFLMAIGLSLCFGLMRIISLDQLLYYSVGAYITYTISVYTRQHVAGRPRGDGRGGHRQFRRGAVHLPAHLRAGHRLHHDHLLRDSDRRRRRHQGHLGTRSPAGSHADHDPDGRSWARKSPSTG